MERPKIYEGLELEMRSEEKNLHTGIAGKVKGMDKKRKSFVLFTAEKD